MSRILVVVGIASMIGASANAQAAQASTSAQAPARRPRIGYAASPPPEQPARTSAQFAPPVFVQQGDGIVAAPFVVLSDGSILANFGNGYERVLRSCAPAQQQVQVNQNGRDALGRILPPPGIAALQQGSRGTVIGRIPARNVGACYRLDAHGRAEVLRY